MCVVREYVRVKGMIIVLNDTHFDAKGPACRDAYYLKDISRKMLEVVKLSRNAQAVLFTGDVIHRKVGRNVSHLTIRVMIALLKKIKVPVLLVLGNHDLMGNQVATVATQPIGILLESGVMQRIDHHPFLEEDVQIEGIPYDLKFEEGRKLYKLERKASVFILGMHAMLSPGSPLRRNIIGPTHVCIGHPHLDAGVTIENGIDFIEFGSLARISTRPYDKRMIRIALLEVNKGRLKVYSHQLKSCRHWSKIYIEKVEKEQELDVEGFAEALEKEAIDSESDLEEIMASLSLKVKARVQYYLGGI